MKFTRATYAAAIEIAQLAESDRLKDVLAGYGPNAEMKWVAAIAWRIKLQQRYEWNKRWRKDHGKKR